MSTITSHIERYIDRYILLFSCTCARVHFSLVIVQLVKNSVQRQIFSSSGFLFQFAKNMSFMHAPCETNFAMANYIADFGNEGKHSAKQPIRELYGVTELVGQMPWHL